MLDDFLVEVFDRDFRFIGRALVPGKKYEMDYMSVGNSELTIPGLFNVDKQNYIQIRTPYGILQGIITVVEHGATETKLKYTPLLSILDVDVYKDRKVLALMTLEDFLASMIAENFVENPDDFQNIPGFQIECCSSTENAAMNLKDNIHNIYDLALKAFRKYSIVITITLDVMRKSIICRIGRQTCGSRTIEGNLRNVLDVNIIIKNDDESVNKVVIVGEYDEESPNHGKTVIKTYYRDKMTGLTTQTPEERVVPVVFRYKIIQIDEETFEEDAFGEAYDLIYQEEFDNAIKVKVGKNDALYKIDKFQIGQPCVILKDGKRYPSIFTGYIAEISSVTLLFGMVRVEYTKRIRRK